MLSSCLLPSPLLCRAAIHCCLAAVLVFDCVERHPSTLLQQMVMPPMVTAFGGGLFVQDMHSRWFAVPETIECENSHASFQLTHLRWLDPPPTAPTRSIMPVQLIRHNAEVVAMTSADKYCPPWSCEYGVVIDF